MKKIWPWLLLLLLIIILCVWTKQADIYNSLHHSTHSSSKKGSQYINYQIIQNASNYTLSGKFKNITQQERLNHAFIASSSVLTKKETTIDETLVENDAITLTKAILPNFIKNYTNGKIVYQDNLLTVYGDVNSHEAKQETHILLKNSMIPSREFTKVIPKKYITFSIEKHDADIDFLGTFSDNKQIDSLVSKMPKRTLSSEVSVSSPRIGAEAIGATGKILPLFTKTYREGKIEYKDNKLILSGLVQSQNDIEQMNTVISKLNMQVINKSILDPKIIDEEKRKQAAVIALKNKQLQEKIEADKAKELALVASRHAEQEALKNKQLKEQLDIENAKKAQELAAEEARIELARLAALSQINAAKAAQGIQENIAQLLKMKKIEFKVAKDSLTENGLSTVDALAKILLKHPNIHIEIAGYTDSDGSESFNQKLSQSRVDSVKKRLLSQNVKKERLTAKGYGESSPLVPNTSDENKQKNRRVEINIQGE